MADRADWMISEKAQKFYLSASMLLVMGLFVHLAMLIVFPWDWEYEFPRSTAAYLLFSLFFALVLGFLFLWASMIYGAIKYDVPFGGRTIAWLLFMLATGPYGAAGYYLFRFRHLSGKRRRVAR